MYKEECKIQGLTDLHIKIHIWIFVQLVKNSAWLCRLTLLETCNSESM